MHDNEGSPSVTVERNGHVLMMGLNRPDKRNAFTTRMIAELGVAYGLLESDDELRCGVLFAHGEHFTEVVPGVVELEVAVPRLRPAVW